MGRRVKNSSERDDPDPTRVARVREVRFGSVRFGSSIGSVRRFDIDRGDSLDATDATDATDGRTSRWLSGLGWIGTESNRIESNRVVD